MNYKECRTCFCCGGENLLSYFDLGTTPLANSYPDKPGAVDEYPLKVAVCRDCFHSQLCDAVEPDMLYKNYLYVSGTSNTLMNYFEWFVDLVSTNVCADGSRSVLDIACNDGSLLGVFKDKGWDVFGVDPAVNLRAMTEAKNIDVVVDYWNEGTASKINRKFDVIVAQNVLAHLPYPMKFLELCKLSLNDEGIIYIQTSQANMVDNLEFDTIYHEHHSFFSANSMGVLVESVGLKIVDVQKVPVHGVSYLFSLAAADEHSQSFGELLELEKRNGRYTLDTYLEFQKNINNYTSDFLDVISDYRNKGYKVVGYGAAAKGSTFICYSSLVVDYIVDDNSLKWGLYTPDGKSEIKNPVSLNDEKTNVVVVVFAWNFFDEIALRIDGLRCDESKNYDFVYVTYFPTVRCISGKRSN